MIVGSFLVAFLLFSLPDLLILTSLLKGAGIWLFIIFQAAISIYAGHRLRKMDFYLISYIDAERRKGVNIIPELWDELLLLYGVLLMLIPGILTDLVGLLLLFPNLRKGLVSFIQNI